MNRQHIEFDERTEVLVIGCDDNHSMQFAEKLPVVVQNTSADSTNDNPDVPFTNKHSLAMHWTEKPQNEPPANLRAMPGYINKKTVLVFTFNLNLDLFEQLKLLNYMMKVTPHNLSTPVVIACIDNHTKQGSRSLSQSSAINCPFAVSLMPGEISADDIKTIPIDNDDCKVYKSDGKCYIQFFHKKFGFLPQDDLDTINLFYHDPIELDPTVPVHKTLIDALDAHNSETVSDDLKKMIMAVAMPSFIDKLYTSEKTNQDNKILGTYFPDLMQDDPSLFSEELHGMLKTTDYEIEKTVRDKKRELRKLREKQNTFKENIVKTFPISICGDQNTFKSFDSNTCYLLQCADEDQPITWKYKIIHNGYEFSGVIPDNDNLQNLSTQQQMADEDQNAVYAAIFLHQKQFFDYETAKLGAEIAIAELELEIEKYEISSRYNFPEALVQDFISSVKKEYVKLTTGDTLPECAIESLADLTTVVDWAKGYVTLSQEYSANLVVAEKNATSFSLEKLSYTNQKMDAIVRAASKFSSKTGKKSSISKKVIGGALMFGGALLAAFGVALTTSSVAALLPTFGLSSFVAPAGIACAGLGATIFDVGLVLTGLGGQQHGGQLQKGMAAAITNFGAVICKKDKASERAKIAAQKDLYDSDDYQLDDGLNDEFTYF